MRTSFAAVAVTLASVAYAQLPNIPDCAVSLAVYWTGTGRTCF